MLIIDEKSLKDFYSDRRLWQGIPGIERTRKGRLFAAFYSGGTTEQLGNFCVLIKSDDDGQTWSEPVAAAYKGEDHRCYDPCLWTDPSGRLWFIWSVMPEHGVWAAVCREPDSDTLDWSVPQKIGNDVMMNKPVVISDGSWLFPIAVWNDDVFVIDKNLATKNSPKLSYVYRSRDNGASFIRLGGACVPWRRYDEHMLLEGRDGSLTMYVRTKVLKGQSGGIGKSISYDGGQTWTPGVDSGLRGPDSRFHIRRLSSGSILMINHYNFTGRNNLTAMISRDEGRTWGGFLLLDERKNVSYPDAVEADNGSIYIIYDRERGCSVTGTAAGTVTGTAAGAAVGAGIRTGTGTQVQAREILLAKVTEADIEAGKIINPGSRLKMTVSRLTT